MIDVAILGASGYGGQELLRYLAVHPRFRVAAAVSGRWAGRRVAEALPHLEGFHERLAFADPEAPLPGTVEGVFLAVPHGTARALLPRVEGRKVVDLSMDFRLETDGFVYGLTEHNRERLRGAERAANPGCFATGALLALGPLARAGALAGDVVLAQTTGSSGSGAHEKPTTHHPERAQDQRAYKVLAHQHEAEIRADLARLGAADVSLAMVPQSGPFARGIFTVAHARVAPDVDVEALFADAYAKEPFVRVREKTPTLRHVARTNFADVAVHAREGHVVALSAIDNLGKGMAGQAIQNMNLLFDLDETAGLRVPGSERVNRDELIAAAARLEIPSYTRLDVVAARGEGPWIFDVDGTRYLDLYGGHAVALLGHAPARVVDAIANQARDLLFYSNAVHVPSRVRAAERLARLAPWDDARVFFVNSGAEANETALKMARQATGRTRVASFHGGFHGRTIGALAVAGMAKYRAPAAPLVDPADAFRFLELEGDLGALDETCAAVIVEPIQSMGGMRVLRGDFARQLRARCDEVGALLIFDEIQTAPARTGEWFAGDRWDLAPDLITSAKAIAAGFPAGVVLTHEAVAATVKPGDQGTTFGGGPVACAAIDATLAALEEIDGPARARAVEAQVRDALDGHDVLGRGALLGVRVPGPEVIGRLREEHRVLVGGCPGDATVIRLFPPVDIATDVLDAGLAAIREVLS